MAFWSALLRFLQTESATPTAFSWAHGVFVGGAIISGVLLCCFLKPGTERQVRRMLLVVSLIVLSIEMYKQLILSISYSNGRIVFRYPFYIFPFQFCSTPIYVGLAAALVKNPRWHERLCAYLATYSVFAGVITMVIPSSVFHSYVGINLQTMVCHGSMLAIGIYLYYTGYVKAEWRTLWKAFPLFVAGVIAAIMLNEVVYHTILPAGEVFNMYFLNPHYPLLLGTVDMTWLQRLVPPLLMPFVYVAVFSVASALVLYLARSLTHLQKNKSDRS